MQVVARTLRYLAYRYLAAPHQSNLDTARANEPHAILRKRLRERADVDAYLRAAPSSTLSE